MLQRVLWTSALFLNNFKISSAVSARLSSGLTRNKMEADIGMDVKTEAVHEGEQKQQEQETNVNHSAHDTEKETGCKRPHAEEKETDNKKTKIDDTNDASNISQKTDSYDTPFYKKRKVAMLMIYSGKGYLGMQRNPGVKTIEDDLIQALVKAKVVTESHASVPGVKMSFQRAARTDKGVSAAGQVVSLKMFPDVPNALQEINSHLPEQIRVIDFIRTTRGFDAKNACCGRTYSYMIPTYAFAPIEIPTTESYRVTDDVIQHVNEILSLYHGTHNFHNFTSGKKPTDASAKRYILSMSCGPPFMQDGLEFVVIKVKGQSFMIHQIRKMIGLMLAIVKGLTSKEAMDRAWGKEKADVPKAPALGLMLESVHYDQYNKKFGGDGLHEAIDWLKHKDLIDDFKKKYIYSTVIETEKEEHSMMTWLKSLPLHNFEGTKTEDGERARSPLLQASDKIKELAEAAKLESSDDETNNVSD